MEINLTNKVVNWQYSLEAENYQISGSITAQDDKVTNIYGSVSTSSEDAILGPGSYICNFNYNISTDDKININYSELPVEMSQEMQILLNNVIIEIIKIVHDN